jgi:hypothetical protein
MSPKLVPTFTDRGCRGVSATDPHGRESRFPIPDWILYLDLFDKSSDGINN